MAADPVAEADLRAVNAKIAASYDLVPFDAPAITGIAPAPVLGVAALYGLTPPAKNFDALDLGCGTGAQMEHLAGLTGGRVVGTDLSAAASDRAAARCARFGARARVLCADFLDLDAAALGQFDLIYNVGVLYVTPPEVQRRILNLIAACLKPGGVAVISYYFGAHALIAGGLREMLRLSVDRAASPTIQAQAAKVRIQDIARGLARQPGDHKTVLTVLNQIHARDDNVFFHEMLGPCGAAISASSLEDVLGTQGVHFLDWVVPAPIANAASPRARAVMADASDLAGGGYHYAVFGKSDAACSPSARADRVQWRSRLVRAEGAGTDAMFRDTVSGFTVRPNIVTEAALDLLAERPYEWKALHAATEKMLSARNKVVRDAGLVLDQELLALWRHGLLTPLWSLEA
jgi:SAM-dependent methyltransferase